MLLRHLYNLFKSPASLYVFLRYVTYGLQFLNSILLVNALGEYAYGIYGFILMFSVYAIYFNLGLNESLNAEYAINKGNKSISLRLWNNTLSFILIWYVVLTASSFIILSCDSTIFSKYDFDEYGYILIITCVIHNISTIYATLYKIHGKTFKVNIQQLLPQLGILFIILLGRSTASINLVVIALLVTNVLSLLICIVQPPEQFHFELNVNLLKLLLKRGGALLLYNLSFQLLTMLALAVVSVLYTVEQMGCYSLANSITNGVIMAGGSFLFIFSPKIINKMGESSETCKVLIHKFEEIYNLFIDLISVSSIVFVWILSCYYPSYGDSFVKIYSLLIAGRIINNASTGYSTYLIATKKESILVMSGIISLIFTGLCYGLIFHFSCTILWIPLIILFASIIFSCLVIVNGQLKLSHKTSIRELIRLTFGQSKWLIILIVMIYSYIYTTPYVLFTGLIVYLIFNYKAILRSAKMGYRIVSDKHALNF